VVFSNVEIDTTGEVPQTEAFKSKRQSSVTDWPAYAASFTGHPAEPNVNPMAILVQPDLTMLNRRFPNHDYMSDAFDDCVANQPNTKMDGSGFGRLIEAFPTVRDHTTGRLGPDGDEYIPRDRSGR
jgi:hypothetical protein